MYQLRLLAVLTAGLALSACDDYLSGGDVLALA